jgi:hypothetical protein
MKIVSPPREITGPPCATRGRPDLPAPVSTRAASDIRASSLAPGLAVLDLDDTSREGQWSHRCFLKASLLGRFSELVKEYEIDHLNGRQRRLAQTLNRKQFGEISFQVAGFLLNAASNWAVQSTTSERNVHARQPDACPHNRGRLAQGR